MSSEFGVERIVNSVSCLFNVSSVLHQVLQLNCIPSCNQTWNILVAYSHGGLAKMDELLAGSLAQRIKGCSGFKFQSWHRCSMPLSLRPGPMFRFEKSLASASSDGVFGTQPNCNCRSKSVAPVVIQYRHPGTPAFTSSQIPEKFWAYRAANLILGQQVFRSLGQPKRYPQFLHD